MKILPSPVFTYQDNSLFCEDIPVAEIVEETGTPVYIYSKKYILDSYYEMDAAFNEIDHQIFYSMKANSNLNICRLLAGAGSGIDCNSGGEVYRALKAGVNPAKIIFAGVGKTEEEIRFVLENNILMLKIESRSEMRKINKIAGEMGKIAPIGIRINPDVDPKTHPYISTGLSENKFGIDSSLAFDAFNLARSLPNLKVIGIDSHIGSQITSIEPFVETAMRLAILTLELKRGGFNIQHIDLGGGIGIQYKDEKPLSPREFAEAVIPKLKVADCKIIIEPGRYITGNAGILVTKVLYTKKHKEKNFLIVDAGMNDLLRPSLYDAYHHIQCVKLKKEKGITADIVGPVCESGDFFAKDRKICNCREDDLLAIMSSGAYGNVMSSNYNARLRIPEVIVDKNKFFVVTEREEYEDLVRKEKLFDELI
jgi:diaminopimelate decarboxylase